jgi:hypothetical protein
VIRHKQARTTPAIGHRRQAPCLSSATPAGDCGEPAPVGGSEGALPCAQE